jgi:hypothetical protein
MPRYFVPISKKDFEEKLDRDDLWDYRELYYKVIKDLKVGFDLENVSGFDQENEGGFGPREIMGIRTLPNGMTYAGIMAGGDWECPVFWIVYWDGRRLRGYVPTDGNPYNTDTMEAYGNNPEADGRNLRQRLAEPTGSCLNDENYWYANEGMLKVDVPKVIADIENRIRLREQS